MHVTQAFKGKVIEISSKLGIPPDDLMAVMAFESRFDPAAKTKVPGGSATGLVQIIKARANELETTTEALSKMSAVEQLKYVYAHLKPRAGDMKTLSNIYMAVFRPIAVGEPENEVLFKIGTEGYSGIAPLDIDGDGQITKAEATQMVINRRDSDYKKK